MDNKRFLKLLTILLSLLAVLLVLVQVTNAQATTAHNAFVMLENRDGCLNVRTAPVDGKVIGYLHDGRDVVVVDVVNGWALVCNPDDLQDPLGWVCMDYLHIYGGDIEYETEDKR